MNALHHHARRRWTSHGTNPGQGQPGTPQIPSHVNMLGRYSFQLPDLSGGLRHLRDKNAPEDE